SGTLFRVLISPRPRVRIAKVNPDGSLLRLETPAPRPLPGAGDRARSGRGECGRPPDGGRRPHARRNVSAPPGLHALESWRDFQHQVRGAPDLMHLVAPQDNESGCTWKNEFTATDANHDGHPEYVHGRMLGTCIVDANHNGVPEAGVTIARDFQVWDNDSDGTFNAL